MHESKEVQSSVGRALYVAAGFASLALGVIGAFLPVMPTTVFVLLAAACFARGSTRLHDAVRHHRWVGSTVRQWEHDRSIPPRARRVAIAMVMVGITGSIIVIDAAWLRVVLGAVGMTLIVVLARLPSRRCVTVGEIVKTG